MRELSTIFSESAPLLEEALRKEEASNHGAELQLRGPVCGLATAALQLYMRDRHHLALDRRVSTPSKAPRGLNFRSLQHVNLFHEGAMIDPSFGQFFAYVGLDQEAAHLQPDLARLFPAEKIAVVQTDAALPFADRIAAHMHSIEPEVANRRPTTLRSYPPVGSLVGTTLEEKEEVMRDIWDPSGYETPFPIEDQSSSFQKRALRIAMRMHELEDAHVE